MEIDFIGHKGKVIYSYTLDEIRERGMPLLPEVKGFRPAGWDAPEDEIMEGNRPVVRAIYIKL